MSQLGTKRRGIASTSTSSGPFAMSTDLASLFECPVCFDYVLPPILQCQSGHLVCSNCRPKLTCCPTCRGPLGNIRNLAMEKVASNVMFPCKHSGTGCTVTLIHTEKADHEETCEFRPYSCPCPGASCKWQGSLEQVMHHLMTAHKSITTLQGEDIVFLATDINLPGAVDWVMMQSCFGHHFMLVLEKQEKFDGLQQFFAIVQLIGSRKQAENFAYRLELNGHRRRLTWEAMPRSIHEGVSSAITNSDCLVFDTSIAQLFADNGNLGINIQYYLDQTARKVDNFFKHTSISQVPRRFNDCYYYCYSQCTKQSCEFRHEPASLRCEIICPEWLQGNCMDLYCPLRHMYLLTDRSQIDCWWEDKPGGCTRPNCAYRHKEDRIRLNIPEKAAENAAPCEVAAEVQVLDNGNDVQDLQQSYLEPENEVQYVQPCFLEPPNEELYVQICYSEPQHDDLYLQPIHEESSGDSVESPKDMPVSPVDQLITAFSTIEMSDTQHGDGDMLVPQ